MEQSLIFVFSLSALLLGAKLLTNSARHIAKVAGVSEFVIGATIVAFGTSMPELASSIFAMLSGHPGLVVGNVIGSNVANIGLALGLASLLFPIYVSRQITDTDIPLLLASAIATLVVFIDLQVTWVEGIALILMYLAFINHELGQHHNSEKTAREKLDPKQVAGFFLGMVLIYFGARYFVSSALAISQDLGVSESLIAFFLVALGTSLPEIATSVIAARSGRYEIAMGNVLGSNAFNSLIILGTSSLFAVVTVESTFLFSTLPAMILLSFLLGFMSLNNTITRLEGILLFLIYCVLAINII
ncbi:MAG: calcium/sodium antiporter [Methanotrichaceae archaeon]|nr:calcium/sodium antiporter [Methanotrichaceae archaeon]